MDMQKRRNKLKIIRLRIALTAITAAVIAVICAVCFYPRLSIKLMGEKEITVAVGEEYIEPGFSAHYGKNEFSPVNISGEIDTNKVGSYTLTYTVTRKNTTKKATRIVNVCDLTAPVITVKGVAETYKGSPVSEIDLSYTAKDNVDGDCTANVQRTDTADSIILSVTDKSGNKSEKTIPVRFIVDPGKKVIYLTFDDGPSPNTPYVLDILKQYNVKATFFVTGQHETSFPYIERIHKEGHTVAAHTYSHKWEIYKSADSYFADLDKINSVIKQYTGKTTTLIRFPGGSSNLVSAKHKQGIMTEIASECTERGYTYFDWNVDSMDTSTSNPDKIFHNITSHLGNGYYNILMHDTKLSHRQALPKVIEYGLNNGYTFLSLNETSPAPHHSIKN